MLFRSTRPMNTLDKQDVMPSHSTIPYGLCHCGCGQKTQISKYSDKRDGTSKGFHRRYVNGHSQRKSALEYVVDPITGCWEWQRGKNAKGYGSITISKKFYSAHRYIYEKHKGPIPEGKFLDHLCRNPGCVNPSHLEPVSNAENTRRAPSMPLTVGDVRSIKNLLGKVSGKEIAAIYNVSPSTISLIKRGLHWKEIDNA